MKTYYITDSRDRLVAGPFYDANEAYKAMDAEEEFYPDRAIYLEVREHWHG